MAEPNVIGGLVGGLLIGLAAVLLFAFNGRIAGVSGILGGIVGVEKFGERLWRIAFVLGLVAGAAVYSLIHGGLPLQLHAHSLTLAVAGLFVGFGTRLGSGCTSGHGVCGLARRSPRSLVATITFMLFGIITVYLTKQFF
jgi:uncharacterized membrane protein YedE/YeeE